MGDADATPDLPAYKTRVVLVSGRDYRVLQDVLDGTPYEYTAQAGHRIERVDGESAPYELIVYESARRVMDLLDEHATGATRCNSFELR